MAKHALPRKSNLFASVSTILLVFTGLALPTVVQATTIDVDGQSLSFNQAQVNGAGPEITQPDGNSASQYDIGNNLTVGEYVDFYNVITLGAQQIDARVTVQSLVDQEGTGGTADQIEYVDEADADAGENAYLKLQTDYQVGSGNSYAELKIQFFTTLSTSPAVATLQNLKMSTYDLDAYQYVELNNFDTFALSTNTTVEASEVRGSYTRFIDTTGTGYSSPDSETKGRVTVTFNSVSELTFRVGKIEPDGVTNTGSSTFYLDFSVGKSWSGLEAAAAVAPHLVDDPEPTQRAPRMARFDSYLVSSTSAGSRELKIEGVRLWCINSFSVDGTPVTVTTGFSSPWYEYLTADITGITPGQKTLVADTCMGRVTYENWVTVAPLVEPKSMWFKATRAEMSEALKRRVASFNSNLGEGYSKVRCIVNSPNGEELNLQFAEKICEFARSNDISHATSVIESKDSFAGRGYWINLWVSDSSE